MCLPRMPCHAWPGLQPFLQHLEAKQPPFSSVSHVTACWPSHAPQRDCPGRGAQRVAPASAPFDGAADAKTVRQSVPLCFLCSLGRVMMLNKQVSRL